MEATDRHPVGADLLDRSVADALRSYALPLGCPVGYLQEPRVVAHARAHGDDPDIHTFVRGGVGLVSLPDAGQLEIELDEIEELVALTRQDDAIGATVELRSARLIVGKDPAAMSVLDEQTLVHKRGAVASIVINPSRAVLDMLRNVVPPHEWSEGGGDAVAIHRVGALAGGVLVALATVEKPLGRMTRMRVIVDPTCRRRGFGRVVILELAKLVLREGLLPYCRLRASDVAARALANATGFVAFAQSLTMQVVRAPDAVATDRRG